MTRHIYSALLIALVGTGFSLHTMAQTNPGMPGSPAAKAAPATADAAMAEALVKKIDKSKGTVTLAHGALPNGMPPMTMAYRVKDAEWLNTLTVGQKIRFATDPKDGGMTVVRFELVK